MLFRSGRERRMLLRFEILTSAGTPAPVASPLPGGVGPRRRWKSKEWRSLSRRRARGVPGSRGELAPLPGTLPPPPLVLRRIVVLFIIIERKVFSRTVRM